MASNWLTVEAMFSQPLDEALQGARRVLICGIGGGYDCVCGLPLVLELEARGVQTFIANLTFTPLAAVRGSEWLSPHLLEVSGESTGSNYLPEKWLAAWLSEELGRSVSVFCLQATGMRPLSESYQMLGELLHVDTMIAIDGGVDSLLRGDEHSLGTPLWDALSMGALQAVKAPRKLLVTTALGAERWDKIAHADALQRIAELSAQGAFLGCESLVATSETGRRFVQAVEWMLSKQPDARGSIVISSMLSSLRGEFGERPVNTRTHNTPIWVSPLLALYWWFDLESVIASKQFMDVLRDTDTLEEAGFAFGRWMDEHPRGNWHSIPI